MDDVANEGFLAIRRATIMIMKADHGGDDFEDEASPFFPDVPLKFEDFNIKSSDHDGIIDLRTDAASKQPGPKMLRRRLMDEIKNLSSAR